MGEFQQELMYVLPFAYWHYKNGTLKKTVSSKYTKEFYRFSPNHEERFEKRNWIGIFDYRIPNVAHVKTFNEKKWKAVPYKEWYQNDLFKFEKPILVIANRYNVEWDGNPISFFDIPTLEKLIMDLKDHFQLVYNRPSSSNIVGDNSTVLGLNEKKWIRKSFPEVLITDDLYTQYKEKVNNFNHLQLMIYANCSHFISTHGGTGTLASCFGGINILFSKNGYEHYLKEFVNVFPKLSNSRVHHVSTYEQLHALVDQEFLSHQKNQKQKIQQHI